MNDSPFISYSSYSCSLTRKKRIKRYELRAVSKLISNYSRITMSLFLKGKYKKKEGLLL